jgi:hypothetical protein
VQILKRYPTFPGSPTPWPRQSWKKERDVGISDLPGISDSVAKAVVEERERRGGFRRPEDLLAVRGIKEKRLKKILPFIVIFPNN